MATYSGTTDPNVVNKQYTGSTEINITEYILKSEQIQSAFSELQIKADVLYADLKPIYDAGLLPTGYTTQYLELEDFINL